MTDIAKAVRRQVAEDSPRNRKVYLEAADTIASLTKRAEDAERERYTAENDQRIMQDMYRAEVRRKDGWMNRALTAERRLSEIEQEPGNG